MPIFVIPLALLAAASIPALMAIYWLRNRYRKQTVSSLHLWLDHRAAREGGRRMQRMQLPLLLLLEVLVLALLALAASDPRVEMASGRRPLVVVLDDSFSMQAGARDRAAAALDELLHSEGHFAARLLLARQQPRMLGRTITTPGEATAALADWRCEAPAADLDRAIALAYEIGGKQARVLVLTDHAPPGPLGEGRLRWLSFGRPQANVAIVNATRSRESEGEAPRVLLEIANDATTPARTQLTVNGVARPLELAAGETRRLWLDLPDANAAVHAELADDALPFDNAATLLPEAARPVRVRLDVSDEKLDGLLRKALDATGRATLVRVGADLAITDHDAPPQGDAWRVRFNLEPQDQTAAFVGPFLVDERCPLTDGVELAGAVWSAKPDVAMPGRPVVTAGSTPLVSVVDRSADDATRYDIHIRLQPELSTVQATVNFPILMFNLFAWRQQSLPGLADANVRLGSEVTLTARAGVASVQVTEPDGVRRELPVRRRVAVITADQPGVYELTPAAGPDAQAQTQTQRFAVNVLSPGESDLRHASSERRGTWITQESLDREYASLAWVLLLAAAGLLVLHAWLVARSGGGGG